MIIWLNGAFGSGKTTCAYELHKRIPNSFVYDPENIGYFIRNNLPASIHKGDFQDFAQWRLFNYEMLKFISQEYPGEVIVPMTLTNRQYYDEIIGRLHDNGIHVRHFILYASKNTLVKRLNKRLELGESWAKQQIDRCISAFDTDICEEKIFTDDMSIDSVVTAIADRAKIVLQTDSRSKLKKAYERILTSFRHIRK